MRITIFGANGPTGRLLTAQALDAGYEVAAVTRRPDAFPLQHDRLEVIEADALDPHAVDAAVRDSEAVLSALGVPGGRQVTTYSRSAEHMIAAMRRHGVRRLAVISSAGVEPRPYTDGGFFFNRVMVPLLTRVVARSMYEDMRRMENLVTATDLDWTILRPGALYKLPAVTDYTVVEGFADGMYTARVDLAACMLALLDSDRYVRSTIGVMTTADNPELWHWIRHEARAKD